jgi:hypothetical protein
LSHQLHQSTIKNQKPKNINGKQAKTTKTQNPFLSFILTLGDSISSEKKKKKKKKEIKNKWKNLWFWAFLPREKKTQTFSPITLIVIKTFVPSTPSIIDQKPKTKTLPQKQAKTTVSWKPFSWPWPSFWHWEILSAWKKRKKKKKKKLKTSEKTFDFEPFCQEKENSNF